MILGMIWVMFVVRIAQGLGLGTLCIDMFGRWLEQILLIMFIVLETIAENAVLLDDSGELSAGAGAKVLEVAIKPGDLVEGELQTKTILIFVRGSGRRLDLILLLLLLGGMEGKGVEVEGGGGDWRLRGKN